jgi:subtilisin family serine protease
MKSKIDASSYLILLFSFLSFSLIAQQESKLNIDLYIEMQQVQKQDYTSVFVPALVKGDLVSIRKMIEEDQGNYKYGVKNIASVNVSFATIERLLESSAVDRIEYRKVIPKNLSYSEDSIMMTNNNAWDAHAGGGVLPHGYRGEGVMLGIIDDGFEWRHPDFLNADATTRIMHLWDQKSTDVAYAELYYGYGSSWDSTDLNRYQCTHTVGEHGSHVMGSAGGNALASGKYIGIAPKTDLACVRVNTSSFLSGFVDGVNFLFDKADASGQPCSINSSVGTYMGGHDAKDLYSQLIDNMLTAKAGRSLSQAAGNARRDDFHLGANLTASTSKTWFKYHSNANRTHFIIYTDTIDFSNIDFSFQLVDPTTYQVIAQTAIYNVLKDFTFSGLVASISQVLFTDGNGNPVTLDVYVDQYDDSYEIYVSVSSLTDLGHWQLTTTGTGKYDIWSNQGYIGTSDMVENMLIPNYNSPDDEQTIVGYWTCSDKVITVGSYQNRESMVTWSNDTVDIGFPGYPKYGISHFSSLGPTRTGLQKPDITAPGGQVISAASLGTLTYLKSINAVVLDQGGFHVSNRGTSMAAPMVAGAVALYLQCKPYATAADIIEALANSAKLDSFVFKEILALPNIHWGYGKLDVYKLLESCLVYGCKDSMALNYNSFATVSDSSCIYSMTGLHQQLDNTALSCQPNPFNSSTTILYELPVSNLLSNASVSIYNSLGQTVFYKFLEQHVGHIQFLNKNLAVGSYWLVLENNGKKYAHQQIVINNH